MKLLVLGMCLFAGVFGCDDDDGFANPCDPANIAEGNCKDAVVADAQAVDMAAVDAQIVDAAPPADMATAVDMTPAVDMAIPVDMTPAVDMAVPDMAAPDMAAPDMAVGCVNPDYNPACADSMDQPSCEGNGGVWGQWVFSEPPVESCDCPARDGGCPCEGGDCEVTCYVPANDGNDDCSDEAPRCWERTQALGCFCGPAGDGLICP